MMKRVVLAAALVAGGLVGSAGVANADTGIVHITIYDDNPAAGQVRCAEELSYYLPGEADCVVAPEWSAPDVTMPGWAS